LTYFRATTEYDGTDYFGFQLQPERPTVQGVLEQALERLTGAPVRVTGAGRTDAGVHARGQVVAFTCSWKHPAVELQRALNAVLPTSVAVRDVGVAPAGFHPRYSARSREYRYQVHNGPVRSPLRARYSLHVPLALDVERMEQAAAMLVGQHDFATFGDPTSGEVTVRDVYQSRWTREGDLLIYRVEANAFLRRMVRTLVTALLWVGTGRWSLDEMRGALAARDRAVSPPPAAPQGLHLWAVRYE